MCVPVFVSYRCFPQSQFTALFMGFNFEFHFCILYLTFNSHFPVPTHGQDLVSGEHLNIVNELW